LNFHSLDSYPLVEWLNVTEYRCGEVVDVGQMAALFLEWMVCRFRDGWLTVEAAELAIASALR
jgi:hypothetical protein